MLRWRLLLGTFFVAALVGLIWLDKLSHPPGLWLLPLAILLGLAATGELLSMLRDLQMRPQAWLVCAGNALIMLAAWLPFAFGRVDAQHNQQLPSAMDSSILALSWAALAMVAAMAALWLAEMVRYRKPGGTTGNLAGGVLGLAYIGLPLALLVQLRMLWGLGALVATVAVVKMGDTGAYVFGHLIGRHKLAPLISPKKTVEGLIGHMLAAALTGWLVFEYLVPLLTPETAAPAASASSGQWGAGWRAVLFGLFVGAAGLAGDLAESLLKRDCGRKDSSRWLPGLGGVLDMLDSLLLAAPAAWLCCAVKLVG
jgi:phosphatidate cytidylyltransferase